MKAWKGNVIVDEERRKVIAVAKYKGKAVRGFAKCSPEDTFDIEKGKELAIARCMARIAEKRVQDAQKKIQLNEIELDKAKLRKLNSEKRLEEAYKDLLSCNDKVDSISFYL